ncbi:hypothetical protein FOA52_008232 [Chlamydomonas sp. UWO 241]|nr:hypothetical protein FOA52_008232 [Chlamydomonas sp. UWO 241]
MQATWVVSHPSPTSLRRTRAHTHHKCPTSALQVPYAATGPDCDAIVVGGGIGGLVTAGRLAREGLSVTLLEANAEVGGRCQTVTLTAPLPAGHRGSSGSTSTSGSSSGVAQWRFDTGPSLLLFPDTYKATYESLGTNIADHVQLRRVEEACYRVNFEGRGHLDMLYDVQAMVTQMEGVEAGAGAQYLFWLASARAALDAGMSAFIRRDFGSPFDMLDPRVLLPLLPLLLGGGLSVPELLGEHYGCLAARFRDERLRAMFTFQDLYVGLSPYSAPGAFSLLAATELTDAVWYPVGGFGEVRDSLRSMAERLGVRIATNARVASIDTTPDGARVEGVTLEGGRKLGARVVVANRDLPQAYRLLGGGAQQHGSSTAAALSRMEYSAGVIAFNWCVSTELPALRHHNVFLSRDGQGAWARATGANSLARSPNFYVHVPSRTDPTAAPPGCESVMVLLPVANLQEMAKAGQVPGSTSDRSSSGSSGGGEDVGGTYAELVAAGREAVLRALAEAGVCDSAEALRACILKEMLIEPEGWAARYGLEHGAAFGLSHGLNQLAAFRPSPQDTQVSGLYFVGASTRPGNGVPLVMIGADLTVKRILADGLVS